MERLRLGGRGTEKPGAWASSARPGPPVGRAPESARHGTPARGRMPGGGNKAGRNGQGLAGEDRDGQAGLTAMRRRSIRPPRPRPRLITRMLLGSGMVFRLSWNNAVPPEPFNNVGEEKLGGMGLM